MDFAEAVRSSSVPQAVEIARLLLQEKVCPGCVLRFLNCRASVFATVLPSAQNAFQTLYTTASDAVSSPANPERASARSSGSVCCTCLGILQGLEEEGEVERMVEVHTSNGAILDGASGLNGSATLAEATKQSTEQRTFEGGLDGSALTERPFASEISDVQSIKLRQLNLHNTEAERNSETAAGPGSELCATIKARVQEAGHQFQDFALEVALPAILLVREHAVWAHLRKHFPASPYLKGSCSESLLLLKDLLRSILSSRLEKVLGASFNPNSAFRCALTFSNPNNSTEVAAAVGPAKEPPAKRHKGKYGHWKKGGSPAEDSSPTQEASLAAVQKALDALSAQELEERLPWPLQQVDSPCSLAVQCSRGPLYVGGRYLKLVRGISQSPWLVDEERVGKETSVQELIAAGIVSHFRADEYKFSSAGREDIDVRMLGKGRPFVLEVLNARKLPPAAAYADMQASINLAPQKWVKVRDLQLVDRQQVERLREGEAEKQKEYVAVVWLPRPVTQADLDKLNSTQELVLQQRTPIRVLHRRSPLIRPRIIHSMRAELVPGRPQYFVLYLCTQAGTYVKEFVHGDLGRTIPSVGSLLGCEADILQLDVTNIRMDFP